MMKKILCLFLALACVISLGACGKTGAAPESTDGSSVATTTGSTAGTLATEPSAGATQETTTNLPTEESATPPTNAPTDETPWDDDGVLKILTIGNSFSVDCMQFVYEIAQAAGVEKIKLGNLYIPSAVEQNTA